MLQVQDSREYAVALSLASVKSAQAATQAAEFLLEIQNMLPLLPQCPICCVNPVTRINDHKSCACISGAIDRCLDRQICARCIERECQDKRCNFCRGPI